MAELCVVDTNVPITANGNSHMSMDCTLFCQKALHELMRSGKLLLDNDWLIISEYQNHLTQNEANLGAVFLKWVLTNHTNPLRVEKRALSPSTDANGQPSFDEFPDSYELQAFDPTDRKFVALAASHPDGPPILQATDSKWLGLWSEPLKHAGITVKYLCKEELQQIFDAKNG